MEEELLMNDLDAQGPSSQVDKDFFQGLFEEDDELSLNSIEV